MTSIAEHLSAKQIKAARALLAWSQQDLARAARVATSTVADFERGARTPVANNADSIREAFETAGLVFLASGVVSRAMLPPPPAEPHAGALVRWVNATHLSVWGESRAGQGGMPELVSRLVYATVGAAAQVRFPSDESIQQPGWDGVCIVSNGGRYVPSGVSVWEIGAQRSNIRGKADEDFDKRSRNPLGHDPAETTFVFVTPQRFRGRDEWVAEKRALKIWRDVVALDADDLVHWLETCPAVAQWLSVRIGRRPKGLRNLEDGWAEWAGTTTPALSEDLVLTGRDDAQAQVLRWLRGPAAQFSVQAEAPDEAIAFLYAAISPLPAAFRLAELGRCVIADAPETARELIGLGTPLVVVLPDPDPGLAQRLVADGHHVFGAFGPSASGGSGLERLTRPWRDDLRRALEAMGVGEEEAHRLAHACGRSITVLRRIMPAAPQHRTAWANPAPPELIAAMFAGAWSDAAARDRQVVSDLAGRPYEEVVAALAPLAGLGGPLTRSGELWKVVSLRDLWSQIGAQVTPDQLRRFEGVFQAVLGEINPRFTRRPKSLYYEAEGEFGDEPSGALRHGLTEALIALAVYPERAELVPHAGARAVAAVRKLLGGASPALWWSLSGDFHNIAEAAPEAFLEALDEGLEGDDPSVMSLFRSDEGMMHPTEYLSNLLWALEMLARSPDHLPRAAEVLARLDDIDPGGKWGNRPSASLRRIFLSWSPQTYATPEQRLRVLDRILHRLPHVGWRLLLRLAPRHHDSSEPSSKPNWRDFATDEPEVITWQTVGEAARAVGARLLAHVGHDAERWIALTEHWAAFEPGWRTQAAQQFEAYAATVEDPQVREQLRDTLRRLVQQHRGFSSAQWAMPEHDLEPFDRIMAILEPTRVEDRVRWLFQPGHGFNPKVDHKTQEAELEAAQTAAADALLAAGSPDALFAFARTVTLHSALGIAVARTSASPDAKFELMKRGLRSDTAEEADVGVGILWGLRGQAEDPNLWVTRLWEQAIDEAWGEAAEIRIVHRLPTTPATWAAIDARSESLAAAYWRSIASHWIPNEADPAFVVDRLLAADRARDAVAWLGHSLEHQPGADVIIRALRAAPQAAPPPAGNDATMFSYYVAKLLQRLDDDPAVGDEQIVPLEWIYYQALRYSERPARTLHRALSREPQFFVDLIKLIFLPAKDSGVEDEPRGEDLEQTKALASQAYDVLHDWAHVPGADEAGAIDELALERWVKEARKLLKAAGRGDIGDSKIGEVLSASVRQPDEPWPPTPVREVIETVRSRALESGFEVGVYNRRGVTVRMPRDGGEQERALAQRYRADADALRFDWPRTAACLDRIADTYEYDAAREDLSAEQRDWL